jgi:sec-independent protein translocase protein TatC
MSRAMVAEAERAPAPEGAAMSLLEHLDELRRRLVRVAAGLAVGFALCYWQADALMDWCQAPYLKVAHEPLSVMAVSEAFFVKIRLAFVASLFLVSPWTAWQAWLFVRPALYAPERRFALPFLFSVAGFFLLGGWFGYRVGLPYMLHFLLGEAAEGFDVTVRAESYVSTFTSVILGLGLVFEAPVLAAVLARLGLLDHAWLARKIRPAILVIAILAAIITPSGDIPTMLVFAVPMLGLYVLSMGVAWAFRRRGAP